MDTACPIGTPETERDLHRGTESSVCWSSQADHASNRQKWIHDCRHPQSVRWFRGFLASQYLLSDVHFSQTESRHLWSGAIGHRGITKPVVALPSGRQSQGLNSVWPQQSRIHPDIQSGFQNTSLVVRNYFDLRHCHRAPGRQHVPGRWPVQRAPLRDPIQMACGMTIGHCLSRTVGWSIASDCPCSGFRLVSCRRLGNAHRPTNDRWHRDCQRGEPMESHRGGIGIRGEDVNCWSRPPTGESDMSISWQPWVRSVWSS